MNSFENYELEQARGYLKEMNCNNHDSSLESLVAATLDCKWNTEDIESLVLKEIFKTVVNENNEYEF
jgi:hypothetical protein